MFKYVVVLMALLTASVMPTAEAAENYLSPKQELIGYRGNYSMPGVLAASPSAACLHWPSYHGDTYIFVGVSGGPQEYLCLGKYLRNDGIWIDVMSGTAGPLVRPVCDAPYESDGAGCVLSPPKPNPCPCTPEPINLATGHKFLSETIYQGSGAFPLSLSFHYNSDKPNPIVARMPGVRVPVRANSPYELESGAVLSCDPLNIPSYAVCPISISTNSSWVDATAPGIGWQANFQRGVTELPDGLSATVSRLGGKGYLFNLISGVWRSDPDVIGRLVKLVDTHSVTVGWKYTTENDDVESFNEVGRLISVTNRSGLVHLYNYGKNGKLSTITDSFRRQLGFLYDASNRLSTFTDPKGQIFTFGYDGQNNLINITFPDSKIKSYFYEDTTYPHVLTGIADANNVRYMNYHYDDRGRATSEEHTGSVKSYQLTLSDNNDTTTVIDPLGTSRSTVFAKVFGVNKVIYQNQPDGFGTGMSIRQFTYDANGNAATSTDWNNILTTYIYDLTRNLETSRVEASGTPQARTISTKWHAKFRIPVQINEPLRRTLYAHDANGNVLVKNVQATSDVNGSQGAAAALVGTPRRWTYTYNSLGQVLTLVGPRTDKTTYTYDAQGNLATITDAGGLVTSLTQYDAHGHVGSITDPNGIVTTLSYHPRGWLASRTVSAGPLVETTSYDYDGVGQMTMVTLPDNRKISYTYDDAHRLTDISDNHQNSIHYELDNMGNRIHETIKGSGGDISRQTSRVYDALNRLQQVTGGAQ
jgi:YD repeat-containing protein